MKRLVVGFFFFSSDNFCRVILDKLFIEFLAKMLSLFFKTQANRTVLKNNMIFKPLLLCGEYID